MLIARKSNRQYRIDERQQKKYVNRGYDIFDDKGKLVAKGNRPSIKRVKELEAEVEALKKENAKLKKSAKEATK